MLARIERLEVVLVLFENLNFLRWRDAYLSVHHEFRQLAAVDQNY